MRKPVSNRQFLDSEVLVLSVDGSAVTTSDNVSTGLLKGQHQCYIKKGTGGDSNLVTITFKKPIWGVAPSFFAQCVTADCEVRQNADPTVTTIAVRTLKSTNLATGVVDADFHLFIFGPTVNKEGNY